MARGTQDMNKPKMKVKTLLFAVTLSSIAALITLVLSNSVSPNRPVQAAVMSGERPPGVPSNAISSGDLNTSAHSWSSIHDGGTIGSGSGWTKYPFSAGGIGNAREFYMTYKDRGSGERWSTNVAHNAGEFTHFFLDGYVYFPSTVTKEILNLEMDVNTVTESGETYILATQCAGTVKTWEYAFTVGHLDHWWSVSSMHCDPSTWAPNVWHHVQIAEYRNANGTVTHEWVALDGVTQTWINDGTKTASHYNSWIPGDIDINYQMEGATASGEVISYTHDWIVWRW
jgi:hypothetical protein